MTKNYPTYEDHQKAWEELAAGITSIKDEVREVEEGFIPPNSKQGSLTILGSGIETIGIAVGDIKLIEDADKVLFCVADPATIVWLKRLRPDALDLYVLYGENLYANDRSTTVLGTKRIKSSGSILRSSWHFCPVHTPGYQTGPKGRV